uniref:Elicitin n=1 Tax=Peronospora matthiolae TaxID=2874970 RepID=A0AAV1TQ04_9STRA
MKTTAFLSTAALVVAVTHSTATECDMGEIEGLLFKNATKGLANCQNATGIDIFAVDEFPTLDQVTELSQNVDCTNYLNQVNQVANQETQCNITIEGVSINFGTLIASFLTGKTGNESDSGSGSIEIPSSSDSGSESFDLPATARPAGSNGVSGAYALSLVAYCVATTIALALL